MVEGMWGFGMAFHNIFAVVPVFIQQLGAPIWVVSIIPALFLFLLGVPQFISAFLNRDPTTLFKRNMILHYMAALPLTLMFIAFFIGGFTGKTGVLIYLSLLVFYALIIGFLLPVWADFLHSASSSGKRGSFFGWTFFSSSFMGFLGGVLLKQILSIPTITFPKNFGIGFGIFACSSIIGSSFFFLMKREKPDHDDYKIPNSFRHFIREFARIWKTKRGFRNYIISRAFFSFYLIASAFFAVLCKQRLNLDISITGVFTATLVATSGISSVILGKIGDNYGYKKVIALIYLSYIIASLLTFHISSLTIALLIFVFAGIGNGGMTTGFMNVIYIFAEPGMNKIYYSMVDGLLAPVIVLVLTAGSLFVTYAGLKLTYAFCLLAFSLALLILWKKVDFPK